MSKKTNTNFTMKEKKALKKRKRKKTTQPLNNNLQNSLHYRLAKIAHENPEIRLDMLLF